MFNIIGLIEAPVENWNNRNLEHRWKYSVVYANSKTVGDISVFQKGTMMDIPPSIKFTVNSKVAFNINSILPVFQSCLPSCLMQSKYVFVNNFIDN